MRRFFYILLGVSFAVLSYFFVSDSSNIGVDQAGRVVLVQDKVRAALQGGRFWQRQLELVDVKVSRIKERVENDQNSRISFYKLIEDQQEQYERKSDDKLDPRLIQAERLRRDAERLEYEVTSDLAQDFRIKQLEELEQIRARILRQR
jgi:preprotein translocase subunit SecF